MARITQKALKILAERIAKKIREEKKKENIILPRKVQKLVDERNFLNERLKHLNSQISNVNLKISNLGYVINWNGGNYALLPKDNKNVYINYEKDIFEELVLTNEFTKKNIEDIEKEIIAKYLKK